MPWQNAIASVKQQRKIDMTGPKFPIQRVSDSKEKGASYKEKFKRYNKAKASVFILSAYGFSMR